MGGSSAARLRGTVLGAALGASVGVPAGLLQDKVIEWMPEEAQRRRAERFRHTEEILAGTGGAGCLLPVRMQCACHGL